MAAGRKPKFVMRPPQVLRVGTKKTSFANFTDICKTLHRYKLHIFMKKIAFFWSFYKLFCEIPFQTTEAFIGFLTSWIGYQRFNGWQSTIDYQRPFPVETNWKCLEKVFSLNKTLLHLLSYYKNVSHSNIEHFRTIADTLKNMSLVTPAAHPKPSYKRIHVYSSCNVNLVDPGVRWLVLSLVSKL